MWRERILSLCSAAEFAAPCSSSVLEATERALAIRLPSELGELLGESDGVLGEFGLGLVWPAQRIVEDNLGFRSNADFAELYMPFDSLLFFADAGNGDQFAYSILAAQIRRSDIFVWDHENDSRTWVAPSLERYIDWWLSGRIQL